MPYVKDGLTGFATLVICAFAVAYDHVGENQIFIRAFLELLDYAIWIIGAGAVGLVIAMKVMVIPAKLNMERHPRGGPSRQRRA